MSENEYDNEEDFLGAGEVDEEVVDTGVPPPEDDDVDMDDDNIEIDLSNNLWAYFDQHKDLIFTIFAHPTLPMVATGGGDNTAFLWTTHTQPPRFVGELQGHTESVVAGGFTADGKHVISADMTGLVLVHRASKGGQKWTRAADLQEVDEVLWVEVHPRLPYFAFGAPDGSVWVYQVAEDGSLEQLMLGFSHGAECNGGIFVSTENDDSLTLVTVAEDGSVVAWNAFTGAVVYKLLPHDVFKGVESPWVLVKSHKNVIAVGGRDGQLAIINTDSGKLVYTVKTIDNVEDVADLLIEALAWCESPQAHLLAVGLVSGDVLLFDALLWRLRRSWKVEDTVTKLQFVGSTPVLVGASMNGKIYQWDSRTGAELFVGHGHNMGVLDFVVADAGKTLVTAGDEGVSLVFHTQ